MRPFVALLIALAVPGSLLSPHFAHAQDATALCSPMFGSETSAILVAFDNLRIDRMEGCNAFKFLLERNGTGTRGVAGCYRSQNDRIIKLSPAFAVGLYRSLTEIEKLYGGKNIIQSGYRCDTTFAHPRGCAADIIWASCLQRHGGDTYNAWRCSSDSFEAPEQKWIDANGKNDRYKIHLRLRYAPEGHHVEPISSQGCTTGPTVAMQPTGPTAPTNSFANQLRQALGMQQQPTPQPMPSQPLQQQQSPLGAFAPTPLPQPTPVSDTIKPFPSGSGTTSVADQLRDIINAPTTTSSQPTASTAPIVITRESAGTIVSVTYSSSTQQYGSGSLQPVGQATFGTNDSQQPAQTPSSTTQRLIQLYQQLVAALQKIFSILRPFGGAQNPNLMPPVDHDHGDEYDY